MKKIVVNFGDVLSYDDVKSVRGTSSVLDQIAPVANDLKPGQARSIVKDGLKWVTLVNAISKLKKNKTIPLDIESVEGETSYFIRRPKK